MYKIYEDNKLIEETDSAVICLMYQAFKDNGNNIEDSLNKAKTLYLIWIKCDFCIDIHNLVDYICNNNIDIDNVSRHELMKEYNGSIKI